jgi:hypothetical protein
MKYLRLFEGFSDEYYVKIDNEEYWDNVDRRVEMSSNDISLLTKLFSVSTGVGIGSTNGLNRRLLAVTNIMYVNKRRKVSGLLYDYSMKIYKVDDEYFYVNIISHQPILPWSDFEMEYSYKCDQTDGLVEFLKNEGFI